MHTIETKNSRQKLEKQKNYQETVIDVSWKLVQKLPKKENKVQATSHINSKFITCLQLRQYKAVNKYYILKILSKRRPLDNLWDWIRHQNWMGPKLRHQIPKEFASNH